MYHRRRFDIFCDLFSTQQHPNVFELDAWPAPSTYHRPFCEHCPRTRVGGYIDKCCCLCSLAAVCWLAPACWLYCAFVAVETRQHHLPVLGNKGTSLPYVANEINVATVLMAPRLRLNQYFTLLLCAGCRWVPLMFVYQNHSDYFSINKITRYRLGGNSPDVDIHTTCVSRMSKIWPCPARVQNVHYVLF